MFAKDKHLIPSVADRYELNGREYFYKCRLCTELRTTLKSILDHQKTVHHYTYISRTYKHIELEPDIRDPNLYCRVCETKYPTYALFQKHLKTIHLIIDESNRLWKNLTVNRMKMKKNSLDIDDSNYFCSLCKKSYDTRKRYVQHLANYHKMKRVRKVRKIEIDDPALVPNFFDPNFYCNYCDRSFSSKHRFYCHCEVIHHLEIPVKGYPDLEDPNFHCKICNVYSPDKTTFWEHCLSLHLRKFVGRTKPFCIICRKKFQSEWYYKRHVRLIHDKMDDPLNQQPPDENDPNYYCRPCDKKLATKDSFTRHIMKVHSAHFPDRIPLVCQCKPCSMTFPSKARYRDHLLSEHNVALNTGKGNHDPNFLPDPNDPDFFCRTCGKTKETKEKYRTHCRNIHHMKLDKIVTPKKPAVTKTPEIEIPEFYCAHCKKDFKTERKLLYHSRTVHKFKRTHDDQRLPDPNALIDVESPNFDCAKCGRTYEDSSSFKLHLKVVHDLEYKKRKADNTFVDRPDLYCSICKKQYQKGASFKKHLTNVHRLTSNQPQPAHADDDTEQVNDNPEAIADSPKSDIDNLEAVLGDIGAVIDNLEAVDSNPEASGDIPKASLS